MKTFFGERKVFEIEMNVTDKIELLKDKLIALDKDNELLNYHQMRLIYPMGKITELNPSSSFFQIQFPHRGMIVLVGQKSFFWDPSYKGTDIQVF